MKIFLTRHAIQRIHERAGLPKRAALRFARNAHLKGRDIANLRCQDQWTLSNYTSGHGVDQVKRYGAFYFVFHRAGEMNLLITIVRPDNPIKKIIRRRKER